MNTFILSKSGHTDKLRWHTPRAETDTISCLSHPPCSTHTLPPISLYIKKELGQTESSQGSWHDSHCAKCLLPVGQPVQLLPERGCSAEGWHLQEEEAQLPKEEWWGSPVVKNSEQKVSKKGKKSCSRAPLWKLAIFIFFFLHFLWVSDRLFITNIYLPHLGMFL